MKHKFLIHYIFIEELNEIIKKNILILKNKKYRLNIITSDKNVHQISQFAKISRIPFYVIDNIKSAIKNYASGVFLSGRNKSLSNNLINIAGLEVIGSAHSQMEYYIKKQQNCDVIMLSPIFFNKKYSLNKILGPIKFNLITLNWNSKVCALGGIKLSNLKMINLTKAKAISFMSLINSDDLKKKPTYNKVGGL
jgi:thiamine monophosphate synthase